MQPAFLLKKKKKSSPTKLQKHYCNPGLWEIKHIAKSESLFCINWLRMEIIIIKQRYFLMENSSVLSFPEYFDYNSKKK